LRGPYLFAANKQRVALLAARRYHALRLPRGSSPACPGLGPFVWARAAATRFHLGRQLDLLRRE